MLPADPAPQTYSSAPSADTSRPPTAQWPSIAWLAKKFPGGLWSVEGADVVTIRWLAYADSWETLLSFCCLTLLYLSQEQPGLGRTKCLGGRGLHRHVAGIAVPARWAGGVPQV